MLGSATASAIAVATLLVFAAIGIRAAGGFRADQPDHYLVARASQGAWPLALSFFASALGAWILFSPPEVGTFAGLLGVLGYAVGQAAAVAVFAFLGPQIRARFPAATTALAFVRARYGRLLHATVAGVSVLYMFVFLAAELTAIGGVVGLLSGAEPLVAIVAVAAATAAYTAYGGLPASLATDRLQAWLVLALVAVAAIAVAAAVDAPAERAAAGGLADVTRGGAETFGVLVLAVVAANLFHQGYWQRVWAARDPRALAAGAAGGAALVFPVVLLLGVAGTVAAGGELETPSLAFFELLDGLAAPLVAVVVVLAVALVASSVDTLQNGLTALVAADVAGGRLRVAAARAVTVALTVPAAVLAVQGVSVLRLFLVADLLAAMIALPVFLGLWSRVTAPAALAGAVAGLLSVVAVGWAQSGSAVAGVRLLTLPEGATLAPFAAAVAASGVVTLAVSVAASVAGRPRASAGS